MQILRHVINQPPHQKHHHQERKMSRDTRPPRREKAPPITEREKITRGLKDKYYLIVPSKVTIVWIDAEMIQIQKWDWDGILFSAILNSGVSLKSRCFPVALRFGYVHMLLQKMLLV